ncbi:hypothetical protein PUN28_013013 [Cardiocondyla obscurior]|uniref:Uncharacterized protein n=1 Tax=Cardiocondyla obscurior TaxID=286306 RepID=A0AAW2F8H8_9HYME
MPHIGLLLVSENGLLSRHTDWINEYYELGVKLKIDIVINSGYWASIIIISESIKIKITQTIIIPITHKHLKYTSNSNYEINTSIKLCNILFFLYHIIYSFFLFKIIIFYNILKCLISQVTYCYCRKHISQDVRKSYKGVQQISYKDKFTGKVLGDDYPYFFQF